MAPLAVISQAAISPSPSPPCLKILSPILRPSPSVRKTQWLWLPQSTPAYHRLCSLIAPLPVQGRAAATFAGPCTGARGARCASGADSPRGVDCGQSIGARAPPGDRVTGGDGSLPTDWLGFATLHHAVGHATFRYASLRATDGVR